MIHHQWKNDFGVGAVVDRYADLPDDFGRDLPEGQQMWIAPLSGLDTARQTAVRELLRLAEREKTVAEELNAMVADELVWRRRCTALEEENRRLREHVTILEKGEPPEAMLAAIRAAILPTWGGDLDLGILVADAGFGAWEWIRDQRGGGEL